MQAVHTGVRPRFFDAFTGHDYVMRSEPRRSDFGTPEEPESPKPPRRGGAGLLYKILTVLLLIIFWPVGLVLLCRRKLRWGAWLKVLLAVITLVACVMLYGFLLTVRTGNDQYTAIQDKVNDFLFDAGGRIVQGADVVAENAVVVADGTRELSVAAWERGRDILADGIDKGIELGAQAREGIESLLKVDLGVKMPEPTAEPDAQLPAPLKDELVGQFGEVPADETTAEPEDNALTPEQAGGDEAPAADFNFVETEGENAIDLGSDGWMDDAALKDGSEPTAAPTATVEPAPTPRAYAVKPAAEAIVYYNSNGKQYHTRSACGKMKTAPAHSFAEVRDSALILCNTCSSPDKALLDESYIAWVDEENTAHLSDECAAFKGAWKLVSADDALAQQLAGCPECGAENYLEDLRAGNMLVVTAPGAEAEAAEEDVAADEDAEDLGQVEVIDISAVVEE